MCWQALDGSKPLDRLASLLERARSRHAARRGKARDQRKSAFAALTRERPELINTKCEENKTDKSKPGKSKAKVQDEAVKSEKAKDKSGEDETEKKAAADDDDEDADL